MLLNPAIHRLVVLMQFAVNVMELDPVHVWRDIRVTRTMVAVLNVFLAPIVQLTNHVSEISASILVQEYVVEMPSVT